MTYSISGAALKGATVFGSVLSIFSEEIGERLGVTLRVGGFVGAVVGNHGSLFWWCISGSLLKSRLHNRDKDEREPEGSHEQRYARLARS